MTPQFATRLAAWVLAGVVAAGCRSVTSTPEVMGIGPKPNLPQPDTSVVPTINVVEGLLLHALPEEGRRRSGHDAALSPHEEMSSRG